MSGLKYAGLTVVVSFVVVVLAYNFSGNDYQSLPASQKLALIWSECSKDQSQGPWPSTAAFLQFFVFSMSTTMDTVADDMPYQGVLNLFRRQKLIHSVGGIFQIKWVSTGNHPYTGLFRGADYALLRCSNAKKPDLTAANPYAPGLSFKFLRTGKKSSNFLAMVSLMGVSTPNFFAHDFTNHVPDLGDSAPSALKLLKGVFEKASPWPTMVGLSDLARFDQNGVETTSPIFPFRLIFHPPPSTRALFNGVTDASDLPSVLSTRITNGPLLEVWAESTPGASPIRIGTVVVNSPSIPSSFGDQYLFFQHQRMDDDFQIHPEWTSPASAILANQRTVDYYIFPNLPDSS